MDNIKIANETMRIYGDGKYSVGEKTIPLPGPLPQILHMNGITVPLTFRDKLDGPRALISAEMPLYTGGAISAKIAAGEASVFESRANEQAQADAIEKGIDPDALIQEIEKKTQMRRMENN